MKIVLSQINPVVGDLIGNTQKILLGIEHAKKQKADIVLFPELALTGYPPDDLLLLPHFLSALKQPLLKIQQESKGLTVIVGTPRHEGNQLFNSAAIFTDGALVGFQDKSLLPTYDVFDERRYFTPATSVNIWEIAGKKVGILICEDIWEHSTLVPFSSYSCDPVEELKPLKPDVVLNLSASPYSINKFKRRIQACEIAAQTLQCPILLCNQVGGNDGLIFDGASVYLGADGKLRQVAKSFQDDYLLVDLSQKLPPVQITNGMDESLFKALVLGVRDYFHKSGFTKACLGLSGGIDSAVVACIAVEALGKENVLGVLMPSRFSSEGSVVDAEKLAHQLGISTKTIPIEATHKSYLEMLTSHFEGKQSDVTEENIQARIRGVILMALSNKLGHIVLSTGNKSELAMGYSTLYGDMCGGLAVISDLTKKQVYSLAHWINREKEIIPENSITKPPSAELRMDQKDSDSLPPYDVVDNVVVSYVEDHESPAEIAKKYQYSLELVMNLIKKIHQNEYKRRQSPPGLRVTEKSFSVGRKFPIVQRWI